MAKAQGKKATTPRPTRARTRSNDAERLAALRWLAMKIEQISIEVFVTNRRHFGAIEHALQQQVQTLRQIGRPDMAVVEEDCPAGFIPCNGLCSPMCDAEPLPVAAPKRRRRTRS